MTEEKKKRGRPKNVVVETFKEAIKNDCVSNYGANENRRVCHACGSANSSIVTIRRVNRLTVRYRVCSDCSAKRSTQEIKQ